jgi:hypothetical protein
VLFLLAACAQDNEFARRTQTDVFLQEPMAEVDILWVVDNSHSMQQEQEQLADGFDAFVKSLEDTNIDFHLAVVSTDMDLSNNRRGVMLGDPHVLTSEVPSYKGHFKTRVQVGIDGSDKEKGISSALAALSEPLVSGKNEGFLREDATLAIIFVSDENDCSDNEALAGVESAACYTQQDSLISVRDAILDLKAMKPPGVRVIASGIVGPKAEDACDGTWPGHRYIGMAEGTGGIVGDICDSDYSSVMEDMGLSVSGVLNTFELTYAAIEESLVVTVDDIEIENDAETGWTYDSEYWLIRFDGDFVPDRGSTIHATYEIGGG